MKFTCRQSNKPASIQFAIIKCRLLISLKRYFLIQTSTSLAVSTKIQAYDLPIGVFCFYSYNSITFPTLCTTIEICKIHTPTQIYIYIFTHSLLYYVACISWSSGLLTLNAYIFLGGNHSIIIIIIQ